MDLKKAKKSSHLGQVEIENFMLTQEFTFLDYLKGGVELNVMCAIDFTASNGDPTKKESLHYISEDKLNQYQSAIHGVCDILLCYDADKKVPMYGFGGCPWGKSTSHCFSLTGKDSDPWAYGLDGIMGCYKYAL